MSSFLIEVLMLVAGSCLTFGDPMNCSPPGSSVHGIPQARTLEWVAISFSRDWTRGSCIAGRFFTLSQQEGFFFFFYRTCHLVEPIPYSFISRTRSIPFFHNKDKLLFQLCIAIGFKLTEFKGMRFNHSYHAAPADMTSVSARSFILSDTYMWYLVIGFKLGSSLHA